MKNGGKIPYRFVPPSYFFEFRKLCGWFTVYFINAIPFWIAGSHIKCIMKDDKNLGTNMENSFAF